MTRKPLFLTFAVLALALLRPCPATAGTTGKINGFVRDQKGAPLPGANVTLDGARQGAVADAKGYYVIINIFPGVYTLTASLIGYDRVSKSPVIVIADQTTTVDFTDQTATVDFALKETALQMSEVTVIAKRPLVEADKTTSEYVVTVSEIERIGVVRSMQDLLQLLPGVSVDGSNRIRGSFVEQVGYGTDVAYIVDGVRMNHNDGRGKGGTFQSVNRGAVQEVSVLAGVMPAEYGNTQAGVVNVVTKEGGNKYHGWLEGRYEPAGQKHWGANVYDSPQHLGRVRWNDPNWTNERDPLTGRLVHQRTDYDRWSGYQAEANASGPMGDRASFVASIKHDQFATPLPGPSKAGFYDEQNRFVPSGPDNLTASGSFTFMPSANLKLKVGGLLQRWSYWNPGNEDVTGGSGTVFNLPGVMRGLGDDGRDLFLPEGWSAAGRQKAREELEYAVLTHALSPKTFYEVRLSRSRSFLDTSGASPVTALNAQDV
ncbi:MAG: carboxypeptidase regulatory-like domain-containing protein, partial [Chloroflexi bacterium]|nr:carboxypeptidase regulatory-like domain-containing protein [Chloroflexota bacterium]